MYFLRVILVVTFLFFYLSVSSISQTRQQYIFYLKNGNIVKVVGLEELPENKIRVKTNDDSIIVYNISEIQRIEKLDNSSVSGVGKKQDSKLPVEEMEAPAPSKGLRVGGGLGIGLMSSFANADYADNGMPIGGGIELSLAKYIPRLKNASLLVGLGIVTKRIVYGTHNSLYNEKITSHTEISALLKFGLPANLPNNMKAFACAGYVLSTADDENANDKILQFGAGVEYPVNAKLSATATALYSMGLDTQLWIYSGDGIGFFEGRRSGIGLIFWIAYEI